MMRRLGTILLALMLSACLGPREQGAPPEATPSSSTAGGDDPAQPVGAWAMPTGFSYDCPAGPTVRRADGLCVASLASPTESLEEPFVAIDPQDPSRVAVGANSFQTMGRLDGTTYRGQDLVVYASEDQGATWSRRPLPPIPVARAAMTPAAATGDPSLVFTPDGGLHVAGIATSDVNSGQWEIFHVASFDMGRTWKGPQVLTADGDNDREWIALGPDGALYLTWQGNDDSWAAWSLDGGATWTSKPVASGCIGASPPAFVQGTLHVACVIFAGTPAGLRVYRRADDAFEKVAELPRLVMVWPRLVTPAGGRPILVLEDYQNDSIAIVQALDDAATAWGVPVDVRGQTRTDDSWRRSSAYWWVADPWGTLHILAGGQPEAASDDVMPPRRGAHNFAHLVLRPDGAVVQERMLTSAEPTESRRVPPSASASVSTDYVGLAFTEDAGLAVWVRDRGLDFTRVRPQWVD